MTGLALRNTTGPTLAAAGTVRAAAVVMEAPSYTLPVLPRAVIDQQDIPCCVSAALSAAMEVLHQPWEALAPLFHYYVTRFQRQGADAQGFLYLASGLSTLRTDGICVHSLHANPYTLPEAIDRPTTGAYADGASRKLQPRFGFSRYAPIVGTSRAQAIKERLRANQPVILGFNLPEVYPNLFLDSQQQWSDPHLFPSSASGHCVLVTGYSNLRLALRIQDSRGPGFADAGGWWMGYRIVDSPIVQEAYYLT